MENLDRAQRWLSAGVRDRVRGAFAAAAGYVFIACLGIVAWFGITWGMFFILAILFTGLGIGPYVLLGLVYISQAAVFPFIRRPHAPQWEIARDIDGNIVLSPPDSSHQTDYAYNQTHGFSFKRVYISLFFATPIALDEAWRELREAARIRKLKQEAAARLAALLIDEQRKFSLAELREHMDADEMEEAITIAAKLTGFQLFANEPQGVALTDTAIDELLNL